jgi:hypothetical protein
MQPHRVRRHLFSCREMSVNRRRSMPPSNDMWIRDISCRSASGPQAINSQPFGQPLQALESAVVRELLSVAGAAGPEIAKASGETRPLGIPTVADRIAQEVARR